MPDVVARVRSLHTRGVSAVGGGRPAEGARLLRAGLRLLRGQPEESALAARLLISLAGAEVWRGKTELGMSLLDEASAVVAPADRGVLLDQRGWVLMYVGRLDEALSCMDEAIPLLEDGDPLGLARGLLNRAMVHELSGRVALCRADLARCESLTLGAGLGRQLAKVRLNRGYCEWLAGDIPAALRAFDLAAPGLASHAPGILPVLAVDRARVLLSAGLFGEAVRELDVALVDLSAGRASHELAEAELIRAHAALALGDDRGAGEWARRAERRFQRRGNSPWVGVAVLTRLRAEFAAGRSPRTVVGRAESLAVSLTALGLRHDAEVASLLAARAAVRAGELAEAELHLVRRRTRNPLLENRLMRRLAQAELYAAAGRCAETTAAARAGLALLKDYRGRLGSVDLRTGAAALGMDLARIGLAASLRDGPAGRAALWSGRPHVVFGWLERTRAQAFQVKPVRPPTDPAVVDAVAALRQAAVAARNAELAGHPDPAVQRRCAELEREIRARGWHVDGTGEHLPLARFGDVSEVLAAENTVLASFFTDGTDLGALVVANGRGELVQLGHLPTIAEAVARLRGDLDAMCGRTLPKPLAEVVRTSAKHQIEVLNDHLVAPLNLGGRDLVIVPTGPLSTVPWNLLPGLRGRPVTVAVSASAWAQAMRRPPSPPDTPLLVAGPNLDHADDEVRKIAEVRPGTVLIGADATVSVVLTALDGRRDVHFATHGHHEPGNFFFSRLDLFDGPLMAYDIHQLHTVPEHVVLSSCDVGRTVVRSGDEMLGFTAALLYSGTRTVVAGVARVPDEAALSVMTAYQEMRAQGVRAAAALAEATRTAVEVPLVCFGCG